MRVIFMGTPDFSVGTLEAIIEAGHEVVLVVTQPDKPKGRGKEMQYTPVKEVAVKHHIPVYQPVKIREPECIDELRQYEADIMIVIAFGQILPREILEMTSYGCVNVHASLLPAYRGAAPIQWAVINGDAVSGVSTMQMDEGLDTGAMLEKVELKLAADETGGSLHDKLAQAGAKLCVQTMKALEEKGITPVPQGDSTTEYARMLDKKMGNIDWNRSAVEIERLIRGLNPWPSAYTHWNGKTVKIWRASVIDSAKRVESNDAAVYEQAPVGSVVQKTKKTFALKTGAGVLEILELQLQGKKRMETDAFLRGNDVEMGEIFSMEQ